MSAYPYSLADVAIYGFLDKDATARFWKKVDRRGPTECWEWLAGKQKSSGHGVFSIKHISCFAHRVSYFLDRKKLPDLRKKLIVLHDCENPGCCNPKHLKSGTVKQNGNYPGCVAKLKARTGPLCPMYGRSGSKHPRWGKKHTKVTKQKIRQFAMTRQRTGGRWV